MIKKLDRYHNPRSKGWDPYDNSHPLLTWYFYKRLDTAVKMAEISPTDTALDIGCWMGHLELTLVGLANYVIGMDKANELCREPYFDVRVESWNCLRIAAELNTIESGGKLSDNLIFTRGDILRIPLPASSADKVFCLDIIEHISEPTKAFQELARVLKPSGILVISLPIELGSALLLRQLVAWFTNFSRENRSPKVVIKSLITNSVEENVSRGGLHHSGYDWQMDVNLISEYFTLLERRFIPLNLLGAINPTVMIKAIKINNI